MFNRLRNYLIDVRQEITKVSWPSFQELINSTYVVLIVSTIFSIFIFSVDNILTRIISILLK
ncbi:preprotein translocase subunit SecE [candidate division KSB1 bacterium]